MNDLVLITYHGRLNSFSLSRAYFAHLLVAMLLHICKLIYIQNYPIVRQSCLFALAYKQTVIDEH